MLFNSGFPAVPFVHTFQRKIFQQLRKLLVYSVERQLADTIRTGTVVALSGNNTRGLKL